MIVRRRFVLALVGFLLFGLFAASAETAPLRICGYNVENWLTMERFENGQAAPNRPKPESEKEAVVKIICALKPDVLGLVEIGTRDDLADLQQRLKTAGLDLPHSEWSEGDDPTRHVALLSRFPILHRNSRSDLRFDLDGKTYGLNRGILDVTIQPSPDDPLRLIGVHLKSRRELPNLNQAAMRAKEAWLVRRHLDEILSSDSKEKIVLFGDLNDTKNEYPIREIIGVRGTPTYMMDLWLTDELGDRWTHFWQAADTYSRIDYILVSPALVQRVDRDHSGIDRSSAWHAASDHRAIYVTLKPEP
jgi:endonuclease/exonuclease/phosphatase family metal-dependent hydrolase